MVILNSYVKLPEGKNGGIIELNTEVSCSYDYQMVNPEFNVSNGGNVKPLEKRLAS